MLIVLATVVIALGIWTAFAEWRRHKLRVPPWGPEEDDGCGIYSEEEQGATCGIFADGYGAHGIFGPQPYLDAVDARNREANERYWRDHRQSLWWQWMSPIGIVQWILEWRRHRRECNQIGIQIQQDQTMGRMEARLHDVQQRVIEIAERMDRSSDNASRGALASDWQCSADLGPQ